MTRVIIPVDSRTLRPKRGSNESGWVTSREDSPMARIKRFRGRADDAPEDDGSSRGDGSLAVQIQAPRSVLRPPWRKATGGSRTLGLRFSRQGYETAALTS